MATAAIAGAAARRAGEDAAAEEMAKRMADLGIETIGEDGQKLTAVDLMHKEMEWAKANKDPSAHLKWSPESHPCVKLVNNPTFENFIMAVIGLNALWIGIDLMANKPDQLTIWFDAFELFSFVENIFCLIFTFEVVVRFFQYRRPQLFFIDPSMYHWNLFDTFLVGLMVFETWIAQSPLHPFDLETHRGVFNGTIEESGGSLKSLSSFRILRLLRISRMVRLLRSLPELLMLLKSLGAAFRGMLSTGLLMGMVIFVWSVIFVQWAKGEGQDPQVVARFGTFGDSFVSLLQTAIFSDGFTVIRIVIFADVGYGCLLLAYVLLCSFTVLNMLIGVIVEIVSVTQAKEQAKMTLQKIVSAFGTIDADGSGKIDAGEMDATVDTLVTKVGLPQTMVDSAVEFLDFSEGEISLNDFAEMLLKLSRDPAQDDILQISAVTWLLANHCGLQPPPLFQVMPLDPAVTARLRIARLKEKIRQTRGKLDGEEEMSIAAEMSELSTRIDDVDANNGSNSVLLRGEDSTTANLVRSDVFTGVILGFICVNALWIGVDIELNDGVTWVLSPSWNVFDVVEWSFMVIFLSEILIRMRAYKRFTYFLQDPTMRMWNIVDSGLVGLMVFETVIVKLADLNVQNLKILSLVRLFRLARISRIIRSSPELSIMVKSLVAAMRSVGSAFFLLAGLIYAVDIIFVQWCQGQPDSANRSIDPWQGMPQWPVEEWHIHQELFGNLAIGALTLLQVVVGDNAAAIVRHTFKHSYGMGVLLIAYKTIGSLTVLNMLIAVICEIVQQTKSEEMEKIEKQQVIHLFQCMDVDLNGEIDREEFVTRMDLIESIGLDEKSAKLAFDMCDYERRGSLSLDRFMTMCWKLMRPPDVADVLMARKNLRSLACHLQKDEIKRTGTCASLKTMKLRRTATYETLQDMQGQIREKQDEADRAAGRVPGSTRVAKQKKRESPARAEPAPEPQPVNQQTTPTSFSRGSGKKKKKQAQDGGSPGSSVGSSVGAEATMSLGSADSSQSSGTSATSSASEGDVVGALPSVSTTSSASSSAS